MNLFENSLTKGIERREQRIKEEILNIKIIPENIEEVKKSLYEKYIINPIIFDENIEQKDVEQYEVSQNFMATFGTIVNKEQRISIKYHINFTGDKDLLFARSDTYLLDMFLSIKTYKVEQSYIEIEHNSIDPNKILTNK